MQQAVHTNVNGSDGYVLEITPMREMSLAQFRREAKMFDDKYLNYDVKQLEDAFWINLADQQDNWQPYLPRYASENHFSDFGLENLEFEQIHRK